MNTNLKAIFASAAIALALIPRAEAQNPGRVPGTVVAWGFGGFGATTIPDGLSNVTAIAAGLLHSIALKSDGTVAAWGGGDWFRSAPPERLAGVVAVSAGFYHSLALKSDGTDLNGVIAIVAAGGGATGGGSVYGGHNLALKSDGTVMAWGLNDHGQSTVPDELGGVVAIAGGERHSLALKSEGTVVVWGEIWDDGFVVPSAPEGLTGVIAIAAGRAHNIALKSDGTVVAWGNNGSGQSTIPAGLNGVVAVAAGGFQSMALKSDGTVVAWGNNDHGQTIVPVGFENVFAIAAGGYHSLALVADAPALVVQASGDSVVLSWPLWAQGFALQATLNLADASSWTPVLTVPVVEGSQHRVTEPIAGTVRFYRLRK
jgi:alpha-tubulin suppressor-like RCC1 family protein